MKSKKIFGLISKNIYSRPGLFWFMRSRLEKHPTLYLILLRILYYGTDHNQSKRIVSRDTDIMIEGFPRSANSYAYQAFIYAQGRKIGIEAMPAPDILRIIRLRIATHIHSPAHIIKAIQLKIPVIVLIRNPRDAIASWKALEFENSNRYGRQNELFSSSIEPYIRYYINFYKTIMPLKKCVVVAEFNDVISDFSKVIDRVNQKYGTDYGNAAPSENQMRLIRKRGSHFFPNKTRDKYKRKIKEQINSYKTLIGTAEQVYRSFSR